MNNKIDRNVPGWLLEDRIQHHAERLLAAATATRKSPEWLQRLLAVGLKNDDLRVRGLRFIDVLPDLQSDTAIADHLRAYFEEGELPLPGLSRWALRQKSTDKLVAVTVRKVLGKIGYRFLAGANIDEALKVVEKLRLEEFSASLDLLGEATVSDDAAIRYAKSLSEAIRQAGVSAITWPPIPLVDEEAGTPVPPLNFSVKLTSLHPRPAARDLKSSINAIAFRLRPILDQARKAGLSLTIDMENYDVKELTLGVFQKILMEPEFRDWPHVGIALQVYLKETGQDLERLIEWTRKRGTPIHIRLVRGAYWDQEVIRGLQHDWEVPVWEGKGLTDAAFETCAQQLFAAWPTVRPVIASHNLRSIALGLALAEKHQFKPGQLEFQMIWGMGGNIPHALKSLGQRLRYYAPFGELIPGMAYLVRRLLENSSSQQALNLFQGSKPDLAAFSPPAERQEISIHLPTNTFRNTGAFRFTAASERYRFGAALDEVRGQFNQPYPLLVNGRQYISNPQIISTNPAEPEQIVGQVSSASREDAEQAVQAAGKAFPEWQAGGFTERATLLERAAAALLEQRAEFAAWEVFEAGKNWAEADADVCEAIDFLRYYARLAHGYADGYIQDTPGETNRTYYRGRGVAVVIPPWNFPLAITVGMTAAALVTGNTCILKPSSLTPVVAARFTALLHGVGLPDGVLNFVPGAGSDIGDYLVHSPGTHVIAFTGSREVGLGIIKAAASDAGNRPLLKRVIAEMGGKNAIIVDEDADLDEAVTTIVQSAFGFQGQKCSACSRVIAVGDVHTRLVHMLKEASASLRIGLPELPGSEFGPVIDQVSQQRIENIIERGERYANLAWRGESRELGWYVPPAIFTRVPGDSDLAQEEIFGPVLSVIKTGNFQEALRIAGSTRYALTGGVYSRHPAHLKLARESFTVGNLYLNRGITGALVGRQPFGGYKHSGTGPKAGGPDYLLPFMDPHTIVENTVRKGAVPAGETGS